MAEDDTVGVLMKELYIYMIGIVRGLVAYFGSLNGVLKYLGVDHDHIPESAFFILVTTVLITSRLAQAAREVNAHADIEARLLAWQKSVPILNDVVYFNHSDEALQYLLRRFPRPS